MTQPPFLLKLASEGWEFEAIHRLNYQTFVEEIPQHAPNPDGRLVDRFHAENRYVIALQGRRLIGMLAMRAQRPFSLDGKVPSLDQYLPAGRRPVEVRLLAVAPGSRSTHLFAALFDCAVRHCRESGHDLAVISGTTRQLKLYRHLGFVPFGPQVGTAAAAYQPMYLTLENYGLSFSRSPALRHAASTSVVNLLPGPVCTTPEVQAALAAPALSHRGPAFLSRMETVRRMLSELTDANQVQVLPGSGSLANAVVAAQLGLHPATGLVLANGEFGERLVNDARRAQLRFDTLRLPWGEPFDLAQVGKLASRLPRGGWLWCVHHETSTGMLNPLDQLKRIAAHHGLRLCVDCVSSLGAVPVDLSHVYLASGSSGKGLGAFPGLALVFHNYMPAPAPDRLPGYLDLGHWAAHDSVPHTHSSNLVAALAAALHQATPDRMERIRANAAWLRATLQAGGCTLATPDALACPGLITLVLDGDLAVAGIGEELEQRGWMLSFRSSHLLARNWLQISLLGDPPRATLESLVPAMRSLRVMKPSLAVPRMKPDLAPLGLGRGI